MFSALAPERGDGLLIIESGTTHGVVSITRTNDIGVVRARENGRSIIPRLQGQIHVSGIERIATRFAPGSVNGGPRIRTRFASIETAVGLWLLAPRASIRPLTWIGSTRHSARNAPAAESRSRIEAITSITLCRWPRVDRTGQATFNCSVPGAICPKGRLCPRTGQAATGGFYDD